MDILLTGSQGTVGRHLAISLERDSIVFYMFMHRFVQDTDRRDELDTIIAEEVGHVRYLQKLRDRLAPGSAT